MADPAIPVNPSNPLDRNKDGVLDVKDLKILIAESIPVLVDWILWFVARKLKR